MIRLLQLIFLGHFHKWKTVATTDLVRTDHGKGVERGLRYIQQCEGCGKVLKRDLV